MAPRCPECTRRRPGPHGLCSQCVARAMVPERRMQSELGRALQERWQRIRATRIPRLAVVSSSPSSPDRPGVTP